MRKSIGFILLFVLLLTATPAKSYEAWQPANESMVLDLAEYEDILDRFTLALERAITSRAAHPQFLEDLQGFQEEFAKLLQALLQKGGSMGYESVAKVPNLTGTWDIVGNRARSTLIIEHRGSVITGTMYGDVIKDGRMESDGTIHLIRSGPDQVWRGTISTTAEGQLRLSGTFDCPVTGMSNLEWEAVLR